MQNSVSVISEIAAIYAGLSPLMKQIADYFISGPDQEDLSALSVSKRLYVSEASLTRFAKKCGFNGYREFLYQYRESMVRHESRPKKSSSGIFLEYQEVLDDTRTMIDDRQVDRVISLLLNKKRRYIYGKGSAGLAAIEFKIRLMKLGIELQAITDLQLISLNAGLLDSDCLVMGISISGQTEILRALEAARDMGAAVVLLSADSERADFCDEVLPLAEDSLILNRQFLSPQLPVLLVLDILFSRIITTEKYRESANRLLLREE